MYYNMTETKGTVKKETLFRNYFSRNMTINKNIPTPIQPFLEDIDVRVISAKNLWNNFNKIQKDMKIF